MGKKPRSERRKKGGKKSADADDADDPLPDDFTILGSDDGGTVFGVDDWETGNANGIDEEGEYDDEEDESSVVERNLEKFRDVLSGVEYAIGGEKAGRKRESGFKVLFKCLTHYALGPGGVEVMEAFEGEVVPVVLASLRNSASEQYAACRVIEAIAVVLGGGNDAFFELVEPALKRIVMATGNQAQVRAAGLRAWSLAAFICSTDFPSTIVLLDLCEAASAERYRGEETPVLLRAAALDSWSLLATTIEDSDIASEEGRGPTILPLLQKALDSDSAELRSSAGECVAMIHEARLNLGVQDEDATATTRRYRRGSWDGTEFEVLIDEVKQRMAELAAESGHHMSKKAKKSQRSTFREYMSTLVDDESPMVTVAFRGGTLELKTWKEIIQLGAVRSCCQGGFMLQMSHNQYLHEIFGADIAVLDSGDGLSNLEKRMFMSKNSEASKIRDREMNKDRKKRSNVKNYFLDADGEDI
ncbi:hypothetical protein TrST_g9350 [Triparma strigata]|uniref:Interferon-related developmental regulator N-terminal domain-containing protein n=1 Tax=Triparma strigata TaxID=1606541 RepID=A0A9W7BU26_9STRA|nr:hypothetical protein TrST_g9350 [Triparma strigata]